MARKRREWPKDEYGYTKVDLDTTPTAVSSRKSLGSYVGDALVFIAVIALGALTSVTPPILRHPVVLTAVWAIETLESIAVLLQRICENLLRDAESTLKDIIDFRSRREDD